MIYDIVSPGEKGTG